MAGRDREGALEALAISVGCAGLYLGLAGLKLDDRCSIPSGSFRRRLDTAVVWLSASTVPLAIISLAAKERWRIAPLVCAIAAVGSFVYMLLTR